MLDAAALLIGIGAMAKFAGFMLTVEYQTDPDNHHYGPTTIVAGTLAVILGVAAIVTHAIINGL